jgi:protein involved in polysaccharide export with SLBB domain
MSAKHLQIGWARRTGLTALACLAAQLLGGCFAARHECDPLAPVPRELQKVALPPYVIEIPDILTIDALRVIPLPPYKIQPFDGLFVQASGTLPNEPIGGIYSVEPEGVVNLGLSYGSIYVADMSVEEAKSAVEKHLRKILKETQVTVSLAQSRGMQQIRGQHIVRPDGTVGLGLYGSVYVTGLTLEQAKAAIEAQLSKFLYRPEVSVDVFSYNSKLYYIITDGAGYGEQVYRAPSTGSETVLDAISQINGLPSVASKRHIWIARPAPAGDHPDQILPIDWKAITRGARTETNYQVFPGDRIYVMAQPLITTDTYLARIISPMERVFGIILLGTSTVSQLQQLGQTTTTTTTTR